MIYHYHFSEQALSKLRRLSLAIKTVIYLWRTEGTNSDFFLYDFSQLKEATNNFSNDNKLGQGGFGTVYKVAMNLNCKHILTHTIHKIRNGQLLTVYSKYRNYS
jgi:hypothetical protein